MNPQSEQIQQTIAAAREGNAPALATVRSWIRCDIAQANPHVFTVQDGLLSDSLVQGPRVRAEVFAPVTAFGHDDPHWQGISTRQAIADVRSCPPLARRLQARALARWAALERSLILDLTLERIERKKKLLQQRQLLAPGRPAWENWVWQTPRWRHDEFDAIVTAWREAPIDWSEERYFVSGWNSKPYSAASAGALFKTLDARVRGFLDVEVGPVPEYKCDIAVLRSDPDQANQWAQALGVGLRFESGASGG